MLIEISTCTPLFPLLQHSAAIDNLSVDRRVFPPLFDRSTKILSSSTKCIVHLLLHACMLQYNSVDRTGLILCTLVVLYRCTVEPRYNEVLGTMKITLLYQVSHYIRVKKQRNIKSWDQQNYLVVRGFSTVIDVLALD